MNLYIQDDNKIIVEEFKVNNEEFIKYNNKKILELYEEDLKNKTSDFLYYKREQLSKKIEYNNYSKIYYSKDLYTITYLFPKINEKSNSIYNKFDTKYDQKCDIDQFNLNIIPKNYNIFKLKNGNNKENLFYLSRTQSSAIKLDYELELLYKLLYLKEYEINYNKRNLINKDEFRKIFSLLFKDVIAIDTYCDLIAKSCDKKISQINQELKEEENLVKKIHMILSKRY